MPELLYGTIESHNPIREKNYKIQEENKWKMNKRILLGSTLIVILLLLIYLTFKAHLNIYGEGLLFFFFAIVVLYILGVRRLPMVDKLLDWVNKEKD